MAAYRYVDGALEPVNWTDDYHRDMVLAGNDNFWRFPLSRVRQERRSRARRHANGRPRGRGRRGAVALGRHACDPRFLRVKMEMFRRHAAYFRCERVLLYLPAGVAVTDEHLRDLRDALRGVTPNEARPMKATGRPRYEVTRVLDVLDDDIEAARFVFEQATSGAAHPLEIAMIVRSMRSGYEGKTPLPLPG